MRSRQRSQSTRNQVVKLSICLSVAALFGITQLRLLSLHTIIHAQERTAKQTTRFDELVREDFFAGMMGETKRLDRGMKYCEDVLAKDPRHAEALVWHGGGLITRAAIAYRRGDSKLGD